MRTSQSAVPHIGIAAILITYAILGVVFSVVTPIFEAPDEIHHYFYVKQLADGGGLPRQDLTEPPLPWDQEGSQPPLYYGLAALLTAPIDTRDALDLLWRNPHANIGDPLRPGNKNRIVHTEREAWPYRDTTLAIHLARWLSLALGAITVWLIYGIARELLPTDPDIALATAALVAFTPQFLFIHSAVSNDAMITVLATLVAFIVVRLATRAAEGQRWWPLLLGVALGLTALAKLSGLLAWVWAGGACFGIQTHRYGWRRAVRDLMVVFGVAALVSGWWYLRNWRLYSDFTGLNRMLSVVGGQPQPLGWRSLLGQFQGLRISYWGLFGWFNVPWPDLIYRLLDAFGIVALLGLGVFALRRRLDFWPPPPARPLTGWWALPASWLILLVAGLVAWVATTPGAQGRLLFPAAWAIGLFLMVGWAGWSVARRRSLWLMAPPLFLAVLSALSPWLVIRPAYQRPPVIAPADVPAEARQTPVYHGAPVRSLGGRVSPDTVRPGETVWATNYWEVLAPLERDYTAFVHMLDQDGRSVAESNSWPGQGNYPTRLWQPGTVVVDEHPVQIPYDVAAPVVLNADFGLFLAPQGAELRSQTADGEPVENIVGSVRVLPMTPPAARPQQTVSAQLGDSIRLLGYDLLGAFPAEAGRPATVTLYWQADRRPTDDYTVFIHLRDRDGVNVAYGDGPPRDGGWPTWAWEPGQAVIDRHTLVIPEDVPAGSYTLWAGMYRLGDESRLPVSGPESRVLDDAIYLQDVVVTGD